MEEIHNQSMRMYFHKHIHFKKMNWNKTFVQIVPCPMVVYFIVEFQEQLFANVDPDLYTLFGKSKKTILSKHLSLETQMRNKQPYKAFSVFCI